MTPMLNDVQLERALLRAGLNRQVVAALMARGGGGAALKYGRFTAHLDVTSTNVETWVLSSGATELLWDAALGGFILNEPGLYACHTVAQIDTGGTPIDSPGDLQLGYSGSGMNVNTPITTNPQIPTFSAAAEFLFTDPAPDTNEIYVATNFDVDPTGFVGVDFELVVVRLGDAPAGAEA